MVVPGSELRKSVQAHAFSLNCLASGAELIRHLLTRALVLSTSKLPCIFLLSHSLLTLLSQFPPTKALYPQSPQLPEGLLHHSFIHLANSY